MSQSKTLAGAIITLAALLSACGSAPAPAPEASPSEAPLPAEGAEPDPALRHPFPGAEVFPEGVAVDQGSGTFYVGSAKDGAIYKGSLDGGPITVFSPAGADGRTAAAGLAFADDRLIVAGRETGVIFVYDTQNRVLVSRLDTGRRGRAQTWLTDVAIAPDGHAYVTDAVDPVLYRVSPDGAAYTLEPFLRFDGSPVTYRAAAGSAGLNASGLVATADGRALVVAQRNEGALFRVALDTRAVTRLEMPAGALVTPDGMFLEGETLYVAQNQPAAVAVLTLGAEAAAVTPVRTVTEATFAFPTAVARYKDRLLVVSSQFDALGSPTADAGQETPREPFWVTELPVAR